MRPCFLFFRLSVVLAAAASLLMPAQASTGQPDPVGLYGAEVTYRIYRDDQPVGQQVMRFTHRADALQVRAEMDLAVRFLWLTAYRFQYRSVALWDEAGLRDLKVRIDDNGEESTVSASREGDGLRYEGPEDSGNLRGAVFPTNHWNHAVLEQDRVFNTLSGKPNSVSIRNAGTEDFRTGRRTIRATRYVYSGELRTEAWYDADGRWVGLRFKAEDGSTIVYRCSNCPAPGGQ